VTSGSTAHSPSLFRPPRLSLPSPLYLTDVQSASGTSAGTPVPKWALPPIAIWIWLLNDDRRYPILLKSLSLAMMDWPSFRGSITFELLENARPALTIRAGADIALALSTPTGLYTPMLTSVNGNSVYDIQTRLRNLQHLGMFLLVVTSARHFNICFWSSNTLWSHTKRDA
jgi:hypothetical protein